MAKKKKVETRNDALNALKSLESKWLKDVRMDVLQPIQYKISAAKMAALIEYCAQNEIDANWGTYPVTGAEELVKIDERAIKDGIEGLQKAGIINTSLKIKKAEEIKAQAAAVSKGRERLDDSGPVMFRCVKPGGVMITDRDEYIAEEQEIVFSEEQIAASDNLQNAIVNEWLVKV